MKVVVDVVYYQHDFRISDHLPLLEASKSDYPVVAVCMLPPFWLEQHPFGFPRMSKKRRQFLHGTLSSLHDELDNVNIPLYVFTSDPIIAMSTLLDKVSIHQMYSHTALGTIEEQQIECIQNHYPQIPWAMYHGRTLHDVKHLPFTIDNIPNQFTQMRKLIEKHCTLSKPLGTPSKQDPIRIEIDDDLESLHVSNQSLRFPPGIKAAHRRLQQYTFGNNNILSYKDTRNGMVLKDDSTKLSSYLAVGSISAKEVMDVVKQYERTRQKNQSTYWLYFELLWRDFFHFTYLKHKQVIFNKTGIRRRAYHMDPNPEWVRAWIDGKTGYPLVDANMLELKTTGYISNRGRQNVASFFVHYLKQDWRIGADYFASQLLDYDPASNYLNWQYLAGVGNDSRDNRIFNVETQGERYDKNRMYLLKWLPKFERVPIEFQYKPYKMNRTLQQRQNFVLGRDYPRPIVKKPF